MIDGEGWMPWYDRFISLEDHRKRPQPAAYDMIELMRECWDAPAIVAPSDIQDSINVVGLYWRPHQPDGLASLSIPIRPSV